MIKSELCETFCDRVKECRQELGISQAELARRIGASAGFVCDYEKGRRNPTLAMVGRFADALEVEPEKLLR